MLKNIFVLDKISCFSNFLISNNCNILMPKMLSYFGLKPFKAHIKYISELIFILTQVSFYYFSSVILSLISARLVGYFLLLCKLQLICEWNPLKQKAKAGAKSGGKWCQSRTSHSAARPEWFATFCHFRWCKADTRSRRRRSEERSSTLIKIKRFGGPNEIPSPG